MRWRTGVRKCVTGMTAGRRYGDQTERLRNPPLLAVQTQLTQSAQRGGSPLPHGISGTVEVEFFGLPSMSLSE